jgi:hypothetical protein
MSGVNDWNEHIRQHFSPRHKPMAFTPGRRSAFRYRLLGRNTLIGRALIALQYNRYIGTLRPDVLKEMDKPGSLTRKQRFVFKPDQPYPEYGYILREFIDTCRREQVPCLFLTQPHTYDPQTTEELKSTFWMTPPRQPYTLDFNSMIHVANMYNDALLAVCKELNQPCFDLASQVPATAEFFTDDCHFRDRGSLRVAETLAPIIVDLLKK